MAIVVVVVLVPLSCLLLLLVPSRCGIAGQWNALFGSIPLVPIPDGARLLSARASNDEPIQGAGGTIQRLYGELYVTPALPEAVVTFYKQSGAACSQHGSGITAYWHCEVDASGSGWGWVDVFTPEAYQVVPPEQFVDSYHFNGPVPHEGTILRTFVNWCDDI